MTRLLFHGLNFAPEEIGVGYYSSQMIEYWLAAGHHATIVTGKPYYPHWEVDKGYGAGWIRESFENAEVVRCPIYVPSNPTGARRVAHYASFGLSTLVPMLYYAMRRKPDLVMSVAPSLIAAPVAWLAAKICGAKCWLHVQDFEVQAAFATGLLADRGIAARLAAIFERWVFGLFDTVSTLTPQMCVRLEQKGVPKDRIVEFRNWADLDGIGPLQGPSRYRDLWHIRSPHVALYSGNIANKQGLDIIVEAARILRHRDDLTFVICGNGSDRKAIEQAAHDLPNLQLHDLQPRADLEELLGLATIHLLPQLERAADLMMPSKLANMLASGRPIIATATEGTGLSQEVQGAGLVVRPREAGAFAGAITTLIDTPSSYEIYSRIARVRAVQRWNKREILDRFIARATRITP